MVEVLIAGGGPAGAAAALVLARAGVRVLIVDRARFPRHKLCGDTLNPGALALLQRLGLRQEIEAAGVPLHGMVVTGPGGTRVTGDYGEDAGLAVTRSVLDHVLLQAAARAGAQVQEAVRVVAPLIDDVRGRPCVRGAVLQTAAGRLRVPAACTIAAEGRRSALALALGLIAHPAQPRRWAVGAYYADLDGLTSVGEMHIRHGHYIGIAPVPGAMANVCLVTASRAGFDRPDALLDATLRADHELRERFARASRVDAVRCVGPLGVDSRHPGSDGLLLAGDAAGFIDPMTGDGLRLALRGGMLAAEASLAAFERPVISAHRWLASARSREFGGKLRVNRWLRTLVASRAGVAGGERIARVLPGLVRGLIRHAADIPPRPTGFA